MRQIVVVAGGSPKYWPDMSQLYQEDTFWIGVDRGAWFLLNEGIAPDVAVGDFDSLTKSELAYVRGAVSKVIQAPAEKDETDTQLALSVAAQVDGTSRIILIGATGGRIDHLMANFWLMSEPRFMSLSHRFSIKDNQNTMTFYQPGSYDIQKEQDKYYIGFLCVTPVSHLSLEGFKYSLDNHQADYPISFASNEFLEESGSFSFTTGQVVVVQSRDK